MPHNHDKKYSKFLEYLIDLNFLKTMLPDHGMYCEMQLLSLLDFSFTVSLFLVILTLLFKLLEKFLKITHKTCWHIYTRPPIGVTPSECFISCEMCSDNISLKLGMDLKVNRNIYPVAVTCDRMRLIGPKSGQLGPINHCLLGASQ